MYWIDIPLFPYCPQIYPLSQVFFFFFFSYFPLFMKYSLCITGLQVWRLGNICGNINGKHCSGTLMLTFFFFAEARILLKVLYASFSDGNILFSNERIHYSCLHPVEMQCLTPAWSETSVLTSFVLITFFCEKNIWKPCRQFHPSAKKARQIECDPGLEQ